ncbi:MAG: Glycosyl transferase family 2, partial [Candidatus Collierbacteria bacterium GW2011_GWC2_43_12]
FFSIVIPVLNEEKYLPLLLRDLSEQKIHDFEVIIVDGHSTDNSIKNAKIFNKLLPSLTIVNSEVRNVSVQRNLGAKISKGKYLLFNDADNRLPDYFLEGVRFQLHVKPIDIFTCWFHPDSQRSSDKAVATYMNLLVETASILNQPAAYGAMIGCLRKIYQKIGGFNPEVGFAEDTEFVNRGFKKGFSFGVIHEPRFVYSFRRFRKIGKIKLIQKYALLNLKYLTNQKVDQKKEYPMGGGYLESNAKISPDFIKTIQKVLKNKGTRSKIIDKIRSLISLEENNP